MEKSRSIEDKSKSDIMKKYNTINSALQLGLRAESIFIKLEEDIERQCSSMRKSALERICSLEHSGIVRICLITSHLFREFIRKDDNCFEVLQEQSYLLAEELVHLIEQKGLGSQLSVSIARVQENPTDFPCIVLIHKKEQIKEILRLYRGISVKTLNLTHNVELHSFDSYSNSIQGSELFDNSLDEKYFNIKPLTTEEQNYMSSLQNALDRALETSHESALTQVELGQQEIDEEEEMFLSEVYSMMNVLTPEQLAKGVHLVLSRLSTESQERYLNMLRPTQQAVQEIS